VFDIFRDEIQSQQYHNHNDESVANVFDYWFHKVQYNNQDKHDISNEEKVSDSLDCLQW